MDRRDYYVEYYEVLDRVLSDYVNQLREKREHWLKIGRHDVGVPLIIYYSGSSHGIERSTTGYVKKERAVGKHWVA